MPGPPEKSKSWDDIEPVECPACGGEYSKKGFNPHPFFLTYIFSERPK